MRLFIGSIEFDTTAEELTEFMENEIGPVKNIYFVTDKRTGRFRGFAFVEFINEGDGERAINELNNVVFHDRRILVKEALPRPTRY